MHTCAHMHMGRHAHTYAHAVHELTHMCMHTDIHIVSGYKYLE